MSLHSHIRFCFLNCVAWRRWEKFYRFQCMFVGHIKRCISQIHYTFCANDLNRDLISAMSLFVTFERQLDGKYDEFLIRFLSHIQSYLYRGILKSYSESYQRIFRNF